MNESSRFTEAATSGITAWKVSKYEFISGPYFPIFSPNTAKYGPEITPYLDTFHVGYSIKEAVL